MQGKVICSGMLALFAFAHPLVADAHPFHWALESVGFTSGLIHPLLSSDHILTMLAVGMCLFRSGPRFACVMPWVFVVLMLVGGGLTLIPVDIAQAENLMYLAVLMLGLMLVSGFRLAAPVVAVIVAAVAVFHGYVHAYDMLLDVDAFAFTAGFSLATLVLIALGIAMAWLFKRFEPKFSLEKLDENQQREW